MYIIKNLSQTELIVETKMEIELSLSNAYVFVRHVYYILCFFITMLCTRKYERDLIWCKSIGCKNHFICFCVMRRNHILRVFGFFLFVIIVHMLFV